MTIRDVYTMNSTDRQLLYILEDGAYPNWEICVKPMTRAFRDLETYMSQASGRNK